MVIMIIGREQGRPNFLRPPKYTIFPMYRIGANSGTDLTKSLKSKYSKRLQVVPRWTRQKRRERGSGQPA